MSDDTSYRVEINEDGRSGQVRYSEGATASVFYWEFAGGDTIASISVPTEQQWARETPWPIERRAEILQRVATETIRQKCAGCIAEFDRGWIHLNRTR